MHAGTLQLLKELREVAATPTERARGMPAAVYHSEDIHRLEQERIFCRSWLCAGRAAEIPNAGDYLTFSVANQPILILRGEHGEIRAYSNVCLHRMMVLKEGRGNARAIVCPYHAWTYDLNGRLTHAGQMNRSGDFDKRSHRLPSIRSELWQGWIYVTLDERVASVKESLQPLEALVAPYGMADYVPVIHQDHVWQTNWKLLNENFMEGYHGPIVHRETVGAGVAVSDTEFPSIVSEHFTLSTFLKPRSATYGCAHERNQRLAGRDRFKSILPTIFPTHSFSLAPDYLWYLSIRPRGPGEINVRIGVSLAPENHAEASVTPGAIEALESFFDRVNAEDRAMVEGLYRGVQAPHARGGSLSWLERELHDFTRYLARVLAGDVLA
jgi:phenylpropionate dioxygenase-like ring-hydroxylating dioxygenase large terminal subunit